MSNLQPLDVSVCILNRDKKALLKACLESCLAEFARSQLLGEVIVVDNASDDGSPEMVSELFPEVHVIRNRENVGFSAGNNQAIKVASGKYILILNNDTVLLPASLQAMIGYMDSHPEVGLAGPKLLNPDGTIQQGAHRRLPRLADTVMQLFWVHHIWPGNPIAKRAWHLDEALKEPCPLEQVAGCCMLLRREVIASVGAFDEDFYYFYEDVDLCHRIQKSGYKAVYLPESEVMHHGGGTFRTIGFGDKACMLTAGLLRYYKKHKGRNQFLILKGIMFLALAIRLPLVTILSLSPGRQTRRRWRDAPASYLRIMKSLLVE